MLYYRIYTHYKAVPFRILPAATVRSGSGSRSARVTQGSTSDLQHAHSREYRAEYAWIKPLTLLNRAHEGEGELSRGRASLAQATTHGRWDAVHAVVPHCGIGCQRAAHLHAQLKLYVLMKVRIVVQLQISGRWR